MFNSKVFTGIIVVTFLILGVTIYFQMVEMQEYNLFEAIQKEFFGEEESAPAPAPKADTPPADNAAQ